VRSIKQKSQQRCEPSADRDAYVPPKLKEFGPVGTLTQGGSTGGSEMATMLSTLMQ
jgi:hypothetical protein